jgi:hypothetical protein
LNVAPPFTEVPLEFVPFQQEAPVKCHSTLVTLTCVELFPVEGGGGGGGEGPVELWSLFDVPDGSEPMIAARTRRAMTPTPTATQTPVRRRGFEGGGAGAPGAAPGGGPLNIGEKIRGPFLCSAPPSEPVRHVVMEW